MATLRTAALLELLDSLAAAAGVFHEAVGDSAADPGSVAEGAANNVATLTHEIDDDNDLGPLVLEAQRRQADVTALRLSRGLQGERMQAALDAHYGGTGGLNRYLEAEGVRVHPDLGRLGIQIDAKHRFPADVVTFGSVAVTGSGAGTLTAGAVIDRSETFGANTVVRATSVIGAAAIVATLTLTKWDGTSEMKDVTLPAGSVIGATVDVGTHGTDLYVACTAVAFTGGTAGDAFQIRTEVERALAL